jgi:hypothetical protein
MLQLLQQLKRPEHPKLVQLCPLPAYMLPLCASNNCNMLQLLLQLRTQHLTAMYPNCMTNPPATSVRRPHLSHAAAAAAAQDPAPLQLVYNN